MEFSWATSAGPMIASAATFLAIVLAIAGFALLAGSGPDDMQARLNKMNELQTFRSNKRVPGADAGFVVRWAKPMGKLIVPEEGWQKSALLKKLVQAGFRSHQALYIFLGLKLLAATVLPLTLGALMVVSGNSHFVLQIQGLLLIAAISLAGFMLPDLALQIITGRRRKAFVEGFPDALDLLVICVEAGLGLDAGIDRVAKELRISHTAIAAELALTILEVRAGTTRSESLRSMAERINIDQVHALVTLLIQAERFGTSVATALRVFAEEMRVERVQRARETAAKLPTRLIFPVIFCIFPALFLVILGPAAITIMNGLKNTL